MTEEQNKLVILRKKVFALANELAIAGYGDAAVRMHTIHNKLPKPIER
jgi:hypothetical protein